MKNVVKFDCRNGELKMLLMEVFPIRLTFLKQTHIREWELRANIGSIKQHAAKAYGMSVSVGMTVPRNSTGNWVTSEKVSLKRFWIARRIFHIV